MTCHDGLTLNDVVPLRPEAQRGQRRKGTGTAPDDNRSWNCGIEGPTDDPAIEKLRNRQVKNFLTVTLLSLGVPMFS